MATKSNSKKSSPQNATTTLSALLDNLRAIAIEGLSYTQNDYDRARYEKLLELAATSYEAALGVPKEEAIALFRKEHGSITPKVGVDIAVINTKSELLVLKRSDGTWGLPGGWADVGEAPFDTAKRETLEETGLEVTPIDYIGIAHKTPTTHPGFTSQVNICVAITPITSEQEVMLSHEHSDFKWITAIDDVDSWHAGQKRLLPYIFSAYKERRFIPAIS